MAPDTAALGVHVEALCEPCGVWHSITVKPMGDGAEPITKVRPVCWICGHRPLVTTGSGRVV